MTDLAGRATRAYYEERTLGASDLGWDAVLSDSPFHGVADEAGHELDRLFLGNTFLADERSPSLKVERDPKRRDQTTATAAAHPPSPSEHLDHLGAVADRDPGGGQGTAPLHVHSYPHPVQA
jgi:hypothetical protein